MNRLLDPWISKWLSKAFNRITPIIQDDRPLLTVLYAAAKPAPGRGPFIPIGSGRPGINARRLVCRSILNNGENGANKTILSVPASGIIGGCIGSVRKPLAESSTAGRTTSCHGDS